MVDIYLAAVWLSKYPSLAASTWLIVVKKKKNSVKDDSNFDKKDTLVHAVMVMICKQMA